MHHHYRDILDRVKEQPKWWDEHAVPRFEDFTPDQSANIYARACVLLLIECQDCAREYKVCMTTDSWDEMKHYSLRESVETGQIHYGDPPNACGENCCAGSTMNSIPRRVLEFWSRGAQEGAFMGFGWTRVPQLEVAIDCEWA